MKASNLFHTIFIDRLPIVHIIHTCNVRRREGLANFKSHNVVDTSQSYIAIMCPMLFNFVIEDYINDSFCMPVKQSMTYNQFNGQQTLKLPLTFIDLTRPNGN